ncbi:MAG: hypothetical protein JXR22_09085, partial [Prolixibacteraceae bacterium]|nr:hypothetical protein [Prolixibacteraceae bacterium]
MSEFNYYNLFETKGIEYLITIFFFLLLIPFWVLFTRKPRVAPVTVADLVTRMSPAFQQIPRGLLYGKNHLWAFLERNGLARVGINDLLLQMTGAVSVRLLKNSGDRIQKGELFSEIEKNGKVLQLFSPVTGKITLKNEAIESTPGLLMQDPYGNGWLFELEPENWLAETQSFYMADQAVQWLKNEWTRFKDFIIVSSQQNAEGTLQPVLQDGGELQ